MKNQNLIYCLFGLIAFIFYKKSVIKLDSSDDSNIVQTFVKSEKTITKKPTKQKVDVELYEREFDTNISEHITQGAYISDDVPFIQKTFGIQPEQQIFDTMDHSLLKHRIDFYKA